MNKDAPQLIRQDYLNGMSYAAIGRKYLIDPRTAKRFVIKNLPLDELEKRPFPSILDPYKDQIDFWLRNGAVFSSTIHDRLVECGCNCGYTIVNDYVRKKIQNYEASGFYEVHSIKSLDKKNRMEKIMEERQKLGGLLK